MARFGSLFRYILMIISILLLLLNLNNLFDLKKKVKTELNLNKNVCIINPDDLSLNRNFSCIKSKKIVDLYETTVCLHSEDNIYGIWKESQITRIMKLLIRYPHLEFIDIGTNIGLSTMFVVGALKRFTLAIDSYLPNIERIARAVQIENIQHRILLIQNIISLNKTFQVKSIEFDDLLPLFIWKGFRYGLMKIDINTSHNFIFQTGSKIFDQVDIQFIEMQWNLPTINQHQHYLFIIRFFKQRLYVPTDFNCKQLQISQWRNNWPKTVFWIKFSYFNNQTFC